MRRGLFCLVGTWMLLASGMVSPAAEKAATKPPPGPNKAAEPLAKTFSLERGSEFLDRASLTWTENRRCVTCHTNVPHLLARPALRGIPSETEGQVRTFFENRVANWDRGNRGDQPANDSDVVVTAVALAIHDAGTTGKLHPLTRKALDRTWTLQQKDGAWDWQKCSWPPLEHDDYYGAVFAALGVGLAPENYAATPQAQAGLKKLRDYFGKTPPPNLHHQALLMWASVKTPGLMSKAQRDKTLEDLLAKQKADGGWSLPSLGDWKGYDGRDNNVDAASDGYGTGLVVYLLRQGGLGKDHTAVKKGVAWLKANQRVSGRWFTASLNTDNTHFITHAGTAFPLLALRACE